MQIFFHIGTRSGLSEGLRKLILQNSTLLEANGLQYFLNDEEKPLLRSIAKNADSIGWEGLAPELAFSCSASQSRIFLDNQMFLGAPEHILGDQEFYPHASTRISNFASAFPSATLNFILVAQPVHLLIEAVRHPGFRNRLTELGWEGAYELSWFQLLQRMIAVAPAAKFWLLDGRSLPIVVPQVLSLLAPATNLSSFEGRTDWLIRACHNAEISKTEFDTLSQKEKRIALLGPVLQRSKRELIHQLMWDSVMIELFDNNYSSDLQQAKNLPSVTVIE